MMRALFKLRKEGDLKGFDVLCKQSCRWKDKCPARVSAVEESVDPCHLFRISAPFLTAKRILSAQA
jgi:hypothetical protein